MKNSELTSGKIKSILIVRQHHQLGDMLCALPMFAAIRKRFPHSHITLAASPVSFEILNSRVNPYLDEVINYNKENIHTKLEFFNRLFSRKYDIGIVPSTASISRTSHYINFISGAKIRVGVESIEDKINKSANLLTIKQKFYWDDKRLHQTERNLDISRLIGCELSQEEKKSVRIVLDKHENEFADLFFAENFPDKIRPVFAIHAGAAKVQNRWNRDNFIRLMLMLEEKYRPYFLLTSGTHDGEINDYIRRNLKQHNTECVILHKYPIRKVASLLSRVNLYLSNDTGPMHVASYVNAKVVGLFGPTNGYEWGPVNPRGTYIQSANGDIDGITVENVYDFIMKFLESGK